MVLGERNDQGLSPLTIQHTQISGCSLLFSSFFRREGTIKEAVSSFSKGVRRIYAVHRIFARQVKENGYTMCESFYKKACSLLRNKDIHMKSEVPYIIKSKMPQTLRHFRDVRNEKLYILESMGDGSNTKVNKSWLSRVVINRMYSFTSCFP